MDVLSAVGYAGSVVASVFPFPQLYSKSVGVFICFINQTVYRPLALAGVMLLLSSASQAQTDTAKILKPVNIKSAVVKKQEAIVPVQQVTHNDFGKYAAFSVADIVNTFSGVTVKDYGGIGGLKTVSVRSLGASHTGVIYDGIMLNDNQSGQIDLGRINLYNVQAIALYNGQAPRIVQPARAFAAASLIDINTGNPALTNFKPYLISAGVSSGSFGLVNPYIQWQQRLSERWTFKLNGNYTYANGGYKFLNADTVAKRSNGDVRSTQTDGTLYWAKSDSNKFHLQFNYYNSRQGLPGAVIAYVAQSAQRLNDQSFLAQSVYEYMAQNSLHLLVSSKYAQSFVNYTDPNFPNNAGGLNEHYTQHELYQSIALGYHLTQALEVSYAGDVSYANLFSDAYLYAFPNRLTAQNVIAMSYTAGKWQLQANALHTYVTEHVQSGTAAGDRSKTTPTVIASFTPFKAKALQLRTFYKEIYRIPTFSEQYYYAYVPRNVKPEFVRQFDLGAVYQKTMEGFLSDIAFTADAYYNHINDKIIYLAGRSPLTPSVTNLGKVDIKGIDVTLKTRYTISQALSGSLNINYTYQDAIDVTNPNDSYYLDQIPYTPKHLLYVNTGMAYRNAGLNFGYSLASSRYYASNNTPEYFLSEYGVGNAAFIYKLMGNGRPLIATLAINNVFNKGYAVIRSYPMPGRSFRITLQITI